MSDYPQEIVISAEVARGVLAMTGELLDQARAAGMDIVMVGEEIMDVATLEHVRDLFAAVLSAATTPDVITFSERQS